MPDSTCPVCGESFSPRCGGKPQKYCTKACYTKAAGRRNVARYVPKPIATCGICGIPCQRRGTTALCSDACRQEQARRKSKARQTPEYVHATYLRHRHKWRMYNAKRQARVDVQTVVGCCTELKIDARMAFFGHRCWICGDAATERDHVKPLSKGGWHLPANMRPICRFCNRSKKDQWPFSVDLILSRKAASLTSSSKGARCG